MNLRVKKKIDTKVSNFEIYKLTHYLEDNMVEEGVEI